MRPDASKSSEGGARARFWALPAALMLLLAGAGAFLYVLFAASSKPDTHAYAQFSVGAMRALTMLEAPPPQPASVLSDGEGGEVSLVDFRGQPILVNLWATWCAPCMEEMPTLGALQRRFEGRGFQIVPVNFDVEADLPKARRELDELSSASLPFLADPSRRMMFDVAARGMPTTILYDREGHELARLTGGADWSSDEAAALIEAVLSE
jgi:thiol-disulfide isomerase/thioredoxin